MQGYKHAIGHTSRKASDGNAILADGQKEARLQVRRHLFETRF